MKRAFVLMVVPFKGEVKLVLDFLYSLSHSYISGFSYSVILWDDGSSNEDLDYLHNGIKNNFSNQYMIVKHDNVGYTRAVHEIMNVAKAEKEFDYLLLVNSDIKFKPQTFHSLVKTLNSNLNISVAGCKVIKDGTTEIQHTGTRIRNGGEIDDPYCGLKIDDPITMNQERRLWVNGSCAMYNLHIMRKENLNFDLEFTPAYFEEANLMTKLVMMGYTNMYDPRAVVEHKVNGTMGKERQKYEKIFWENWDKYLKRWKQYFNSPQLQF